MIDLEDLIRRAKDVKDPDSAIAVSELGKIFLRIQGVIYTDPDSVVMTMVEVPKATMQALLTVAKTTKQYGESMLQKLKDDYGVE